MGSRVPGVGGWASSEDSKMETSTLLEDSIDQSRLHSRLNSPWNEKKKKQDLIICCLQKTHCSSKNTQRLSIKGWKKILHANGNQNRELGMVWCTSVRQSRLYVESVTKDKGGCSITITGRIHQEAIIIIKVHAPNLRTPKYRK